MDAIETQRWRGTLAGLSAEFAQPQFPTFGPLTIEIPLQSKHWTIWPDDEKSFWEWLLGQPLELSFFSNDWIEVECRRDLYTLRPHYEHSTFDKFTIDTAGTVDVDALHGLFPWTLGDDTPEGRCLLLEGVCAVTRALPARIPDLPEAALIRTLARQLEALLFALRAVLHAVEGIPDIPENEAALRGRPSYRLWQWRIEGGAPPP